MDLEYGWPGWGEAWATLGLAVRVWLGPRRPAGELVRLVGLAGLLAQVVMVAQTWAVVAWLGAPVSSWWADVLVVGAFAALVAGRRAVGRVAAALVGVVAAVPWGVGVVAGSPSWWAVLFALPAWVTAVLVVVGFHAEAPVPARRWWVMGGAGVVAGVVSVLSGELSWWTLLWAWVAAAVLVALFRPWRAASRRVSVPGR
jgi:hypothetical protein